MKDEKRPVLVVDDDEAVCQLLVRAFGRHGFDVITARSGSEALAVLEWERPGLIVTELVLPDVSGVELLRRFSGLNGTAPVVVLTAHGTPEQIREALQLGVSEFLGKPFELDRLLSIASGILDADVPRRTVAPA